MKLLQLFSSKKSTSTNNTPEISSLKSEELWQFVQRPEGGADAESRASDLRAIWENAQESTDRAARATGKSAQEWALNSH